MTSLIDVIFLLLLFFMLTSTFTRFSELQISAAGAGGSTPPSEAQPLFLRLGADLITLNGREVARDDVRGSVAELMAGTTTLLVSAADDVTSQRLVDLLVALGDNPDLAITVLD